MRKATDADFPSRIDLARRIGVVASTYYKKEIDALVAGAMLTFAEAGLPELNATRYDAPGSFEIPLIGEAVLRAEKADAFIGFGIIVEGETHHARLLAEQATRGIMDVQLKHAVPFAFEILYVHSLAQAQERSAGEHNKGREAALAVLHSLATLRAIHAP